MSCAEGLEGDNEGCAYVSEGAVCFRGDLESEILAAVIEERLREERSITVRFEHQAVNQAL